MDSLYFCIGGNGVVYGIVYGTCFLSVRDMENHRNDRTTFQMVIANVFTSVCQAYSNGQFTLEVKETTMNKKNSALELLIWNKSLKFHGLFWKSQRTMTLSIANLDPPGFTLTDCFKVTSLIGSVGLLQRWEHQGWWKSQRRKRDLTIFCKAVFLFLNIPNSECFGSTTKPAWQCFFLIFRKNHRLL